MVTGAQKSNVQASWRKAEAEWNSAGVGCDFFESLFRANDDIWQKFTGYFKTSDKNSIKGTSKLKQQAKVFGDLVGRWVASIDNPDVSSFAAKHKARGISADQIRKALVHLAGVMKKYGGDEGAWRAVADLIVAKY